MRQTNTTQLAIFMVEANKLIEAVLKKLALDPNRKQEIRDFMLSELGKKVSQDPSLVDAFMQSSALLFQALTNLRVDYFRIRAKRVRREIPLAVDLLEKEGAYCDILFNIYLSQILTSDEERYARLKIIGLTDAEVMRVTGEGRRALEAHKERVREKFLQVFQE